MLSSMFHYSRGEYNEYATKMKTKHVMVLFDILYFTLLLLLCYIYSSIVNTSHTVLGDMQNFFLKHVSITRHAVPFYMLEHTNIQITPTLLMCFCFEIKGEGLWPGWNWRHGKLFTQRPSWNKRILRKIQCVLIKSTVTCIQDQRVKYISLSLSLSLF